MNTIYLATLIFGLICIITITVYLYTLIKRITKKFESITNHNCDETTNKPKKAWFQRAIPIAIASLIILLIIIYNPLVLFVLYFLMASMLVDIMHIIIKKFAFKNLDLYPHIFHYPNNIFRWFNGLWPFQYNECSTNLLQSFHRQKYSY